MAAVRLASLVACCLSSTSSARLPRQPTGPEEFTFPEPKIENVYQAWKPIDFGHPLVDATIHYAPPELERVQLGSGFPVPTRPAQQGNSRNLVFEASRPKNEGLTDHRLQATVYHGKGLVPRDTVVTIPSQRRNDVIQQDPRHGRNQVIQKLPPLKSGIFYVDDPHEEFRGKPAAPQEPPVNRYDGDRNTAGRRDDEISGIQKSEERVHYVPVSLLSTPPTIQPPQKPYGEIVNKDFNELFKKQQRPLRSKRPRSQHRGKISSPGKSTRNSVYPLGNPYYRTPSTQYGPSRLEGVLGPPNPQLARHQPSHAFDSRSSSTWLPAESYNVHASGREIDYRQEPVIFHVRDSGELVDPNRQQPYPQSNAEERVDSGARLEGSWYDPQYAQPARRPYQGSRVRSAPLEMEEMGYSPSQLYQLCTQEVPEYLQHHLCKLPPGHFPNDSGFSERSDVNIRHNQVESPHAPAQHQTVSRHSPRNRTGPSFYDELTREEDENSVEATSLRSVSVRLPPKPQFQFVQDNQYVASTEAMLQERSLPESDDNPYQLIYQTAPQQGYSDQTSVDEPPFPYEQGVSQAGPAPIVYSLAQSKVVVYRPNELTTTTPEPTTTSTTTTTTTTTSSTTTARPFFYQSPETQPPAPRRQNPPRQVLFNKRREGGGGVSRPFEYLSRLSSFLSGRVLPGRGVRPRPRPERPQLITRRTGGSGRR